MYLKKFYGIELPPAPPMPPVPIKSPQGIEPVSKHDTKNTGRLPGPGPM
jgi:hypothetical protein